MKKLRVKSKQQFKAIIKFDYSYYDVFQFLYLKKSGETISALSFHKEDNIKVVCNAYSKVTKCDRNLECALAKCRKLLKGGE